MADAFSREEREEIVDLLDRLGSADDQEVLAAARAVHEKIVAADASWDALFLYDDDEDEDEDDDLGGDAGEVGEEAAESFAAEGDPDAETLRLIEALLAKSDISDDFREELEGYKADMGTGEFNDNDHRYVRAVYKRLNG